MTSIDVNELGKGRPGYVVYLVIRNLAVLMSRILFRLTCSGRENVPKTGAYVMAANHRSNLDIIVISATTRRRQRYMGKDTLWAKQPYDWLLSQLGGFPVTRGTVDREALQKCLESARLRRPGPRDQRWPAGRRC